MLSCRTTTTGEIATGIRYEHLQDRLRAKPHPEVPWSRDRATLLSRLRGPG